MIDDEHSRLRKLERELYTTDIQPPNKRGFLHDKKIDAPEDWTEPKQEIHMTSPVTKPHSIFKRIFLGSLGFLLIALVVFGINLLTGGNAISAQNVDIQKQA
jgi:hypothetical protein